MENQPIRDERILEALEACRPGSDDAADPALAYLAAALAADPELEDLYERLQQVDAALADGFRDVPVPEGVQQRILDRLAAAKAEEEQEAVDAQSCEPAVQVSPRQKRSRRRTWLAGSLVATVAAGLLIALGMGLFSPDDPDKSYVLDEAIRFFKTETPSPGQSLATKPPPKQYPLSRAVARQRVTQWRPVRDFLGCQGAAYDMSFGGGAATLYVVRRTVAGNLPNRPPPNPMCPTGGYAASVWKEGPLSYVLVVKGNARAYRNFLRSGGPLA